jgi:hypothetical protein
LFEEEVEADKNPKEVVEKVAAHTLENITAFLKQLEPLSTQKAKYDLRPGVLLQQ